MGTHKYGFYTGKLCDCETTVFGNEKNVDRLRDTGVFADLEQNLAYLPLIDEDERIRWDFSRKAITGQRNAMGKIRVWFWQTMGPKTCFTERDIRYFQQYLAKKGCPHEDRKRLNALIGLKNLYFGILD